MLEKLEEVVRDRQTNAPAGSYTASLFAAGSDRIAQKFGEEAIELLIASQSQTHERLIEECADLLYHLTVLLVSKGVSWAEIAAELAGRQQAR